MRHCVKLHFVFKFFSEEVLYYFVFIHTKSVTWLAILAIQTQIKFWCECSIVFF